MLNMKHKLTAKDKFVLAFLFLILIIALPFLLTWILIHAILYKTEAIGENKIVQRLRINGKPVLVILNFSGDIKNKFQLDFFSKSIKIFMKNISQTEINFSLYNDFTKRKDIKKEYISKRYLGKITSIIKKQWMNSKKQGGDSYLDVGNESNILRFKFHNDCGIWVSARFLGEEGFLNKIIKSL